MNRIEHQSPTPTEDLQSLPHLLSDLRGRAEGQGPLGVHAPSPEHKPVPVLLLQQAGIHPRRGALHRIEDVEPGLDEILDQRLHTATGVDEGLPTGVRVHPVVHPLVEGLEELTI